MPRHVDSKDDWDDENDGDWEGGHAGDWRGDSDDDTATCPHCGEEYHEDSPRCPHCDRYISQEETPAPDAPVQRKPWWIIIGTLAVMYVIYRWIVP